ncbi:MAG: alpha/beta fold hydrolase [Clostridia bacterium]|nr:alpha/beta fold hydrolase [Clostridia bacterium]
MKISNSDFTRPEAQPFLLEGGRHGVLLIHGFTGSVAHMRPVGEGLHEAGFTVQGINLPGHAKDLAAMKKTGADEWLGAAKDAVRSLRGCCETVTAMGLSMGGCISLILGEEGLVDSVVAVSAPMAAQNPLLPLAGVLWPLVPTISWGAPGKAESMLDPQYNLGYGGFPTRCGAGLHRLIRTAKAGLPKLTCPLMVIQSRGDETISADSADIITGGAASGRKKMLWLEEVPHVCTITRETPRIIAETVAFLREA